MSRDGEKVDGFNHPLLGHKEKWQGYTIFKFKFNEVPVQFVTLKDAEFIRLSTLEEVFSKIEKLDGVHHDFAPTKKLTDNPVYKKVKEELKRGVENGKRVENAL